MCPGATDDGDQRCKLQVNRSADAPNSIPIHNAHTWNVIKLGDVDSILDCDRLDIFHILYSLVSPEIINLIIKTQNVKYSPILLCNFEN